MNFTTHDVINQAAPRVEINEYRANTALCEAVAQLAPQADQNALAAIGELVGGEEFQENARLANRVLPEFHSHDRWGNRIDAVEFHPAYHHIMREDLHAQSHSLAWTQGKANTERAVRMSLFAQIEPGHSCPISMTHAVVPSLQCDPEIAEFWEPKVLSTDYDPTLRSAADKTSVTFGMAMTEKQGGSDIRANTTAAYPIPPAQAAGLDHFPGEPYRLIGHKWFCSAPQSDAFLMLAQLPEGVSCFVVPRVLPDGQLNGVRIQRLKDKLGNKANASSEIELAGAIGWRLGEPGRGVKTIIEMVSRTRLDCIIGTAAGMRQGVAEASWHARHRSAFGARLIDQPLMQAVIADLQLEAEAATWTMVCLSSSYDHTDADSVRFRRLATAIAKYWICKRGPHHAYEALECLGGNGYTESFPLAMRYREQPVLAVWEGSGNVIALDVLRALTREPETAKSFMAFLESATGSNSTFDAAVDSLNAELTALVQTLAAGGSDALKVQRAARVTVEKMAVCLQAAVLLQFAPAHVALSFVAARMSSERGMEYGALPAGIDIEALVERA